MSVQAPDGRTGSAQETIRVNDILIVALGDSLATGEGNPEMPARWESPGFWGSSWALGGRRDPSVAAVWADGGPDGERDRVTRAGCFLQPVCCTREPIAPRAGPAQFAMRLEAQDCHTSVTFVCLAATGGRAEELFVSDKSGCNRALGPGPPLPAQLDELRALSVRGRLTCWSSRSGSTTRAASSSSAIS